LGSGGMEGIVEFDLSSEEAAGLRKSTDAVKELCAIVDRMI